MLSYHSSSQMHTLYRIRITHLLAPKEKGRLRKKKKKGEDIVLHPQGEPHLLRGANLVALHHGAPR